MLNFRPLEIACDSAWLPSQHIHVHDVAAVQVSAYSPQQEGAEDHALKAHVLD
jgi:hypothetical protein